MDELERFKSEINLTEYAASRGYRLDRRESSRNSVVMRHPATDDKIIVGRAPHDRHWIYFSVRDERDHGTIVDFVRRRGRGTLADVRGELQPWIGADRPAVATELYRRSVSPRTVDRGAVARVFGAARAVANIPYLNSRGIRPATLGGERFAGTFRADGRGNVLFPHSDHDGLAGFESKNHGWTSFSPGGVKALWRSRSLPDDRRLVLVESAIDALSFCQLDRDPHASFASTAGSLSEHQRALLGVTLGALPAGTVIVLAFDHDDAGDKLADQVRAIGGAEFSRSCSPIGKDWNDCLRELEHDYIRGLGPTGGLSRQR
jgi:Toprim-like